MNRPESNPFPFIFALAGFLVLTAGIWWIYRPAALIVAGLIFMVLALLGRRGTLGRGGAL